MENFTMRLVVSTGDIVESCTLTDIVRMADLPPVRPVAESDTPAILDLVASGYRPSEQRPTRAELEADFAAYFRAEYGEVWRAGSVIVPDGRGHIAALILCVLDAQWPKTPTGPFITDLFVAAAHRRRRLAAGMIQHAEIAARVAGLPSLSLRVDVDNVAAIKLYQGLGFCRWESTDASDSTL